MPAPSPRVLLSDFRTPDISAEVPFLFKRAGCTVELFCAQNSWLRKNSYWDTWHAADVSSQEAYAKGLAKCVRAGSYDWIVLTEDEAIGAANAYIRDEALAARILPIRKVENRALLASKAGLSRLAAQYGLPTPVFSISDGAMRKPDVPFPLLVKIDHSSGGEGVFFCANQAALDETLDRLSPARMKNLVFQKYIVGANLSVEALFKDGALVMHACSTIEQTVEQEFSVSSARMYYQDAPLEAQVREAGRAFGLDGFCTFTFMEDVRTGVRYLIEADTRPNIWFAVLRTVGVDFSAGIRQYLGTGFETRPAPSFPKRVRQFHRDINRSLEQRDFLNIVKWACNYEGRWAFMCWYDRKLFRATLAAIVRGRVKRYGDSHPRARALGRAVRRAARVRRA